MVRKLSLFAAAVGLWYALIHVTELPDYLVPSPVQTLTSLWQHKSLIGHHVLITLCEMLVGIVIALGLAFVTALVMDVYSPLQKTLYPVCLTLQSVPSFILMPLLLMWIGFGFTSKVCVIVLASYFSITLAFINGLKATPKVFLAQAQLYGAKYAYQLIYVRLPFAIPSLLTGLKIVIIHAPITAIAADWIGANEGLGYLILVAHSQLEIDLVFASIVMLILATFILNKLFNAFEVWTLQRMRFGC